MKAFSGYDTVRASGDYVALEPGGYICEIKKASEATSERNKEARWLEVLIDIKYGAFAGYYEDLYRSSTSDRKRWRGVLRVFIPRDDGSENDERTKSNFKGFTTSVEESNPGYTWDWNESALKGKEIGILFRSEEWEYNGKHGWTTRPFLPCSVGRIEDGKYTIPEPRALKKPENPSSTFSSITGDDEELPF